MEMGKKIPGISSSEHEAILALNSNHSVSTIENAQCLGLIQFDRADLMFRDTYDTEFPGRPYMRLRGRVQQVAGFMMDGVSCIDYSAQEKANQPKVTYFYEFTDQQIAELVLKGMYHPGFSVPKALTRDTLEMPLSMNFNKVQIDGRTFYMTDIVDAGSIEADLSSCKYDLADMFEQQQIVEKNPKDFVNHKFMEMSNQWTVKEHGFDEMPMEIKESSQPQKPKLELPKVDYQEAAKYQVPNFSDLMSHSFTEDLNQDSKTIHEERKSVEDDLRMDEPDEFDDLDEMMDMTDMTEADEFDFDADPVEEGVVYDVKSADEVLKNYGDLEDDFEEEDDDDLELAF